MGIVDADQWLPREGLTQQLKLLVERGRLALILARLGLGRRLAASLPDQQAGQPAQQRLP